MVSEDRCKIYVYTIYDVDTSLLLPIGDDHFVIHKKIATGGFSVVYLCSSLDNSDEDRIALKVYLCLIVLLLKIAISTTPQIK